MTKEKVFVDKLKYENELVSKGYKYIAGVDEVGRGPLAGSVVCAAVIMPLDDIIIGVDDSKKVSEKKRDALYSQIIDKAISYCICEVSPQEIDELNILNATKKCMKMAIEGLEITPDVVLIDAVELDLDMPTKPLIKGDALSYTIGAASIIAKVYRDRQMCDYAIEYPEYGFEKHKGYGTKLHIDAIRANGKCPIHRLSFIKKFI